MIAGERLVLGLLFAHAAWLWFWLCGSAVLRPASRSQTGAEALLDVVLSSATGMAVTAALMFGLGLVGFLYPWAALVAVPALGVASWMRGDSPLRPAFYQRRVEQLAKAATPGALIVWMFAVFLSLPAVPPDGGSDATAFYLPQALEYAASHALTVDTWFRYPWYPNNWVLMEALPMVFGAHALVQFMNWLSGAFVLLGIYGLVAYETVGEARTRPLVSWVGLVAVLTLAFEPIFLRFSTMGMIDVPSGAFFLIALIAAIIAVRERSPRVLGALIACAAFLIGVKVSYLGFLPLFFGLACIALRAARSSRRTVMLALAALLVLSSAWYARAFVLSGDPVEPVLNLRLHGVDPKMTRDDLRVQMSDLYSDTSPEALLQLPWQMYFNPHSREFRDLGVTTLIFALPLPMFFLAWTFLRRRGSADPLQLTAVALVYAYAYWNLTSHLQRYALIFMPTLAAFAAMFAALLFRRVRGGGFAAAALTLVFAVPPPQGADYLQALWNYAYRNLADYYTGDNLWLEYRAPAYPQLEDLAHVQRRARVAHRRLYIVHLGGDTYFAKQLGIASLGDAFGPGRFADLSRAVEHGVLARWVARFDVGALLVAQSELDADPTLSDLDDGLREIGWRRYRYANSDWLLYLEPDYPRLEVGEGHPASQGQEGRAMPAKD